MSVSRPLAAVKANVAVLSALPSPMSALVRISDDSQASHDVGDVPLTEVSPATAIHMDMLSSLVLGCNQQTVASKTASFDP